LSYCNSHAQFIMKIEFGPYINHWYPRKLEEFLIEKGVKEEFLDKVSDFLDSLGLFNICNWLHNKRKRKFIVRIDDYDCWNLDGTLAHIIYPALVKLKEINCAAAIVDPEELPEELKGSNNPSGVPNDELIFKQWDWVLDEMIWTFKSISNEDNGIYEDIDYERRKRGLRLFAKYYSHLWY